MAHQDGPAPVSRNVKFKHVTPILRVADFDASLAYYVDVLGFEAEWKNGQFGCVCRGDVSLFLCQGSQGHAGTWIYVTVSDADVLHEELLIRGAAIRQPPTNYPWGMRELHVFDPDGHVLRFGSGTKPDEPLGEWLDEQGARWRPNPDGSWTRVE